MSYRHLNHLLDLVRLSFSRLKPSDGSEYLFASDSETNMEDWIAKISFHAQLPPSQQLTSYDSQSVIILSNQFSRNLHTESLLLMHSLSVLHANVLAREWPIAKMHASSFFSLSVLKCNKNELHNCILLFGMPFYLVFINLIALRRGGYPGIGRRAIWICPSHFISSRALPSPS